MKTPTTSLMPEYTQTEKVSGKQPLALQVGLIALVALMLVQLVASLAGAGIRDHWLLQINAGAIGVLGAGLIALFNSTRKKIEASQGLLKEVETQYQKLIERANDGVAIVQGGIIKFANEQLASMFGYRADEIIGTKILSFLFPSENTSRILTNPEKQSDSSRTGIFEMMAQHRDGHVVFTETSTGTIIYDGDVATLTMVKNVSEKTLQAEKLRHQEKQYRSLTEVMDTSSVGTFILDAKQRVVWLNQAIEIFFEISRDEVIGKSYRKVVEQSLKPMLENAKPIISYAAAAFADDTLERQLQCHVLGDEHREERWLECIGKPIHSGLYRFGRIEHFYDITDRILADKERDNLENQLRQAEKLQAIGQLAGGIAHDFNNQLAGIRGYAEIVKSELPPEHSCQGFLGTIVKSVDHSANLTRQLLAFARQGPRDNVAVDMHDTIHEVSGMLRHLIDKRISIHEELDATRATTIGDPSQLQNALLNLAINARDAMPDGGQITFQTEMLQLPSDEILKASRDLAPGNYLKIAVTDTGEGMTDLVQLHIFEPFFTTKEEGKGTGMGLAAVYGTAHSHGGMITVKSAVDQGTTMSLYLPLPNVDEIVASDGAGHLEPMKGQGHVLVVEDEANIRDSTRTTLEQLGYTVTTCDNGAEAIEFYQKQWQQIDLVLLDMIMPIMDGRETFQILKQINPQVIALLCSGYTYEGDAEKTLEEGARGFIAKPFNNTVLAHKIAELLS